MQTQQVSPEAILDKLTTIVSLLSAQNEALGAQTTALAIHTKEVLSFDEACAYLDVSESHLYKLTSRGIVPHSKPNGKRIYFRRVELDGWLMSNPIKTVADIERDAATYCATKRRGRAIS
jgi:excisionase family DNA binding protein